MAITSTGYDGTVTESQWAKLAPLAGSSHYGISQSTDWKVTANPALDRGVTISTGSGWGHGVLDTSDSTVSLQGATVGSGARWDMVVARRNWAGTGGSTSFVMITGSSLKALPTRNITPGTLDDQPIALVQFMAGQTQAISIVDLRCWGRNGGMVARDVLALNYLFQLGAQVKVNSSLWSCVPDSQGSPMWSASSADGFTPVHSYSLPLDGGPAPAMDYLVSAGTAVVTTDNSGYAFIDFIKPFPNGLMTAIVCNGDASVDRASSVTFTFSIAGNPMGTGSRSRIVFTVRNNGGVAVTNHTVRVNYIAYGW